MVPLVSVLAVYELTLPYRAVVILIVRGREMLTVVVVLGASKIISSKWQQIEPLADTSQ